MMKRFGFLIALGVLVVAFSAVAGGVYMLVPFAGGQATQGGLVLVVADSGTDSTGATAYSDLISIDNYAFVEFRYALSAQTDFPDSLYNVDSTVIWYQVFGCYSPDSNATHRDSWKHLLKTDTLVAKTYAAATDTSVINFATDFVIGTDTLNPTFNYIYFKTNIEAPSLNADSILVDDTALYRFSLEVGKSEAGF